MSALSSLTGVRGPGMRSWLTLIGCEAKMVGRDTSGLIVPILLPLLILVASAGAAAGVVVENGRTALEVFVLPLVITIVTATIGMINMPGFLAYYRRSGILRRLSVTPASPAMVLAAQGIVGVLQALLGIVLALIVAMTFFGAALPANPGTALAVFALSVAALYSVGLMIASVAPTPNSATAIGLVVFFILGALGGMFGGFSALTGPLEAIGSVLPFGASVQALSAAWAGTAVAPAAVGSLALTALLGGSVSALLFRWQ